MNTFAKLASVAATLLILNCTALAQDATPDPIIEIGKTKFEQICIACHQYERSGTMLAPPAFAIQTHYKDAYGSDETAFRQAIVNWAKAPDASKTLMPGAIARFKIMPPLPLPDEDLDAIAAYLYSAAFTEACNMQQGQRSSMRQSQVKP
ncbi:Cytochrome c subfamily, putative [Verrucomicrobiia bacterium DG1235]|nr:Cytochrome c subfamily, putative [Verrucomicrobiae bacterium DG1235]